MEKKDHEGVGGEGSPSGPDPSLSPLPPQAKALLQMRKPGPMNTPSDPSCRWQSWGGKRVCLTLDWSSFLPWP